MDRKDNLNRCLVHRVGDLSLHSLVEEVEPAGPLEKHFPDARSEDYTPHLDWLSPAAYDRNLGQMILPVHSYLVRTSHHNVLIDTCIGNCKQAPGMPNWHQRQDYRLPQMLSDSGVAPEQVDYVLCTHLHLDHVGWNTKQQDGRWVPTFPNARYLFSRTELAYSERCAAQGDPIYEESVVPILKAGLADLVDTDHTLDDEMWLEPLPGHTPGQCGVCLASRGERAVMVGDAIHNPIQLAFPHWSPYVDDDPVQGRVTRRAMLERYCDSGTLFMTAHFPLPSMGYVLPGELAFRLRYVGDAAMVHGA